MFKLFGKLFHGSSKHNGVSDHHKVSHHRSSGKDGSRRARLTSSHHAGVSDKKRLLPHGRARAATYHTHPDTPVSYYPVGLTTSAHLGGNLATPTGAAYYPCHSPLQPRTSALSGDGIRAFPVTVSGVVPLTEENLQLHLSLNPPVKESKYERVLRYVMEQRKYALLDEEAEAVLPLDKTEIAVPKVDVKELTLEPATKHTSGLVPLCSKVGLKPLPIHKLHKRSSATPMVNTPPLQDAGDHGHAPPILGPVVRSSSQPHRKLSSSFAPLSPQTVATSEPTHSSPALPDIAPQNNPITSLEVTQSPRDKDSAVMINDGGDERPSNVRHSTELAARFPPTTPYLPPLGILVETPDPVKAADPQQDVSEPSSPTAEVINQGPDHPSLSPDIIKFGRDNRPELHPKGGVARIVSLAPKTSLTKKDKMAARGIAPTTRHRKSNSMSLGFSALKRILRV
ncbi:hypothetical protein IWQ61_003571 [Dispira simplex]|nr:hypothetical protein IWQ61_003571 [Dispira simplex]